LRSGALTPPPRRLPIAIFYGSFSYFAANGFRADVAASSPAR
jgi:hypothetical protein